MSANTLTILAALCVSVTEVYCKPSISPDSFQDDGAPSSQFTCSAALLPGQVLAWYRSTDVVSDDSKKFREFFPFPAGGTLRVRVRSNVDVYVGLFSEPVQDNWKPLYYEVIIGGWSNTRSSIRRENKYQMYAYDTPNIVSDCEYRGFWVRVADGTVAAGLEGQASPFMWWRDPSPLPVAYYGFSGFRGSVGFWKTEESGYPADELLAMTQLLQPLNDTEHGVPVQLVLSKPREQPGRGRAPSLYCAAHTVLPGGLFSKGVESTRVQLKYTEDTPLAKPSLKVEPGDTSVYFTPGGQLRFSCSGSQPADGRTYSWFRADPRSAEVTRVVNQSYDAKSNVNVLRLSADESHDRAVLYCAQAHSSPVWFDGAVVRTNTYGVVARSHNITLFMKKEEKRTEPPPLRENRTEPPPLRENRTESPPLKAPEIDCPAPKTDWCPVVPLYAAVGVLAALLVAVVVAWACWGRRRTDPNNPCGRMYQK